MRRKQYSTLAALFRYPAEGYKENVESCMKMLKSAYPAAAMNFERFYKFIETKSLHEIEEIFGITFHIQAICFLDLGYVLFGEDYKRGEFLVNMKREQEKANNECGEELYDNLPNVLQLMAIHPDQEFVNEMGTKVMLPALQKMLEEFKAGRMELRTKVMRKKQKAIILEGIAEGNIYQNALLALLNVLEKDFDTIEYTLQKIQPSLGNFLPNCGTCSEDHQPLKTIQP